MCDDADGAVPLFSQIFGRKYQTIRRNDRAVLQWKHDAWGAVRVLRTLQPFLRVKRKQAALALEFMSTFSGYHGGPIVPPETRAKRAEIADLISALNHSHWRRKRQHNQYYGAG